MPYDPNPYRWQDHMVSPRRAAANLVATLIILTVGAALTLACIGSGAPSRPAPAQVAVARHTPQAHANPGLL